MDEANSKGEGIRLLANGTRLRRSYIVKEACAYDAYGATYEALDERERRYVVLNEYYPKALAVRTADSLAVSPRSKACGGLFFLGAEAFLKQHNALMRIAGNPNVASVYDAFFENGTAYAVTEPLCGVTLQTYLLRKRQGLTAGEGMLIAASLADALLVIHSVNTLHYAIDETSIFLCDNGRVKLTGFGAARYTLRTRREADDEAPWIDISALGETLYCAMSGKRLDINGRPQKSERVPQALYELFSRMLARDGAGRLQTVFDYRHALTCVDIPAEGFDAALLVGDAFHKAPETAPKRDEARVSAEDARERSAKRERLEMRKKKRILLVYAGVVLLALAGALVLRFVLR